MLCTPPAFILSQDQTLYELLLIRPKGRLILFCSAYLKFKRNQRVPYISCDTYVYNLLLCTLCCSVFNVRSRYSPLGDSFAIIPQLFPFVNRFFKLFSSFFAVFLLALRLPSRLAYINIQKAICQPYFRKKIVFLYIFAKILKKACFFVYFPVYCQCLQSRCPRVQCRRDGELSFGRRNAFRGVGVASR